MFPRGRREEERHLVYHFSLPEKIAEIIKSSPLFFPINFNRGQTEIIDEIKGGKMRKRSI